MSLCWCKSHGLSRLLCRLGVGGRLEGAEYALRALRGPQQWRTERLATPSTDKSWRIVGRRRYQAPRERMDDGTVDANGLRISAESMWKGCSSRSVASGWRAVARAN
jgi:hypothetical protein